MVVNISERPKIKKNQKHVIWNYEESPEIIEGIRFHWLTIGKLERESAANEIMISLSKNGIIHSSLMIARKGVRWEKTGSKMLYTLASYDTQRLLIDEPNLGRILRKLPYHSIRNGMLRETLPDRTSLEDFVEREYRLDHLTKIRTS